MYDNKLSLIILEYNARVIEWLDQCFRGHKLEIENILLIFVVRKAETQKMHIDPSKFFLDYLHSF